jgi:hypothetical protein
MSFGGGWGRLAAMQVNGFGRSMGGRSGSVSGALLWAITGACALVALGLAASATSATAEPSRRLIVTPDAGRKLPARPVWIRLRAAKGARQLAVRLNGEEIGRYFSAPNARGVRKLKASSSFGLRHGRNRLRVRLRQADGGIRARTIHFRIRRNKPLAGAGIDRTVAVGSRVYLSGTRSRSHLRRSALKHRWIVTRRPGLGSAAGARLVGAGSARWRFVADQPGRYVLRLRVRGRDGRTGSDLVDVRADPRPAARVDTMARGPNGETGIRVGEGEDGFYPAKPGAWAQLVALDRGTLEPVTGKLADLANKSYPCDHARYGDPGLIQCVSALEQDLNRLDGHDLAIVSNPLGTIHAKGTPGFGLEFATTRIGVGVGGYNLAQHLLPGSFSAIGVLGARSANWHAVASPGHEGEGQMRGYLVRNNEREYVFSPGDRIEFDTQASGSDLAKNVITIGQKRYAADVVNDGFQEGGIQVVVADRQTLTATSRYFSTGFPDGLADMARFLQEANDGSNLVFVASRGDPHIHVFGDEQLNQQDRSNATAIANQIEKLGGTRNGIFKVLDRELGRDSSYSLVGWSHAGAGQGVETVGANTRHPSPPETALNTAPLAGTLARTGPNYAFALETSRSVALGSTGRDPWRGATELSALAFNTFENSGIPHDRVPPGEWPEHGNAGHTNAVRWIGKKVFGTDDPRGQYWTVPFVKDAFDYDGWRDAASRIGKLDYASGSGFSADDLGWAKAELQREIDWLISTHRYLDNLSTPFVKGQLESWADFQQIANSIRDKVEVSPDQKVHASARAVFKGILELAGVLPGFGEGFETANAIYNTALELVEINGEPADDEFQARADELGVKLADRLSKAQGMLDRELPNVIAADYHKLQAVGQCSSRDPDVWASCPFDHADWQYTQDDQASAAELLRTELEISAYGSVLPARYTAYQLPPWWRRKVSDDFYGYTFDFVHHIPFQGLPDTSQMAKPIYRNIPTYSHTVTGGPQTFGPTEPWKSSGETWQITALGYLTGEGTIFRQWEMHYPSASITDKLFKPPSSGGFGLDPETFFDQNFTPKPLDHYPEDTTPTGWCAYDADPCGS